MLDWTGESFVLCLNSFLEVSPKMPQFCHSTAWDNCVEDGEKAEKMYVTGLDLLLYSTKETLWRPWPKPFLFQNYCKLHKKWWSTSVENILNPFCTILHYQCQKDITRWFFNLVLFSVQVWLLNSLISHLVMPCRGECKEIHLKLFFSPCFDHLFMTIPLPLKLDTQKSKFGNQMSWKYL